MDGCKLFVLAGAPPEVWVIAEVLTPYLTRSERRSRIGEGRMRIQHVALDNIVGGKFAGTPDELTQIPGAARAIMEWRSGDHWRRERILDAEYAELDAQDELAGLV